MDGKKESPFQTLCDVSEVRSNEFFMTLILQQFSTEVNLNGVRVTEAFIDEICENKEKYSWIPLCVDKRTLKGGRLQSLGHRMNPNGTQFSTEQIGSFVNFWKESRDGVSILYGEARVPKRDDLVCGMLQQLYNAENLNVSFEIVSDHLQKDGDVTVIDADPQNTLIGMAIVSVPAYPDASSAVLMVAEQEEKNDEEIEEGETMDNKENMKAAAEEEMEKKNPECAEVIPEEPEKKEPPKEDTPPVEDAPADEEKKPEEEAPQDAECKRQEAGADLCPEVTADLMEKIRELEDEVRELMPYREMVQASEKDNKMSKLRAFAEKNGLDPEAEDIAAAIAALDAEALIDAVMAEPVLEEQPEESRTQAASFDSMRLENPRAFLYERGTYQAE